MTSGLFTRSLTRDCHEHRRARARVVKGPQRQAHQAEHVTRPEAAAASTLGFELDTSRLDDHKGVAPFILDEGLYLTGRHRHHSKREDRRQRPAQEIAAHQQVGRKSREKLIGDFPVSCRPTDELAVAESSYKAQNDVGVPG